MVWSNTGKLATFRNAAQLSFLAGLVKFTSNTEAYIGLLSDNNDGNDNWRWWSGIEDPTVTWLEWATGHPGVSNAMSASMVTANGLAGAAGTSYKTFLCEIRVPGMLELNVYRISIHVNFD